MTNGRAVIWVGRCRAALLQNQGEPGFGVIPRFDGWIIGLGRLGIVRISLGMHRVMGKGKLFQRGWSR